MYICIYVYIYVCIYVYMYICIYVFMYVHIVASSFPPRAGNEIAMVITSYLYIGFSSLPLIFIIIFFFFFSPARRRPV